MNISIVLCLFGASVKVLDNLGLKLAKLNLNLFRNESCLKFLLRQLKCRN